MKNRRNYYRILHVQPDAPTAVIRASHRAIMQRLKVHPDLGGDHEQAVLLNEAVDTLCDPTRRAAYDEVRAPRVEQQRDRGRAVTPRQAAASSRPTERPTAGPAAAPRPSASPKSRVACGFCGAICSTVDRSRPESACVSCGSALCLVEKHQLGGPSQRAIERVPRNVPMTFRLAASRQNVWSGSTEDLSLNGMRFLSHVVIEVGDCLRVECDFCSAVAVVKSVGSTRSVRGPWHYGVEFLTFRVKNERGGLFSTVA